MKSIVKASDKLSWGNGARAVFVLCAMTAIALPAQTFTSHSFYGANGTNPVGAMVQVTNGDLYGTTTGGGAKQNGTIFKLTPSGKLTTVYSFCSQSGCTDGSGPQGALVQATNGYLYGTTEYGGSSTSCYGGCGTVFKISPSGTLTTLYNFCSQTNCTDGETPFAGLVQATNGSFYGTTYGGGANGLGTVFKITPGGTLTTLYSFCSQANCTDGKSPIAGLVQATNGYLYGTTFFGGANGDFGTLFKISPSGTLTTLYSFCAESGCTDGANPYAVLVQATNGDLYGTTEYGGAGAYCPNEQCGAFFKITLAGTLTTLYSFCSQSGCADGVTPEGGLVQATDGDLYGTTYAGGGGAGCAGGNCGTIFKISPSGTLTKLHTFCSQLNCTDGADPVAGLVQATNGDFYGTTFLAGAYNQLSGGYGTFFHLSVGLGPFVETQPASGKAGAAVKILGTDLTGASSVSFNGTAAAFTVVSTYLITTTVPAGATSGKVQVVTPGGTLSSNVPFRVLP